MVFFTPRRGSVPVAWRQLRAEPAKLVVALVAVAAAVALVLLLSGLRRGIGEQVTTYLDHQPAVVVGQEGTRDFVAQTSVLSQQTATQIARVVGVADASPISEGYAMLGLHSKRVLTLLIGYDPGRLGGPWQLAEGRQPARLNELVLDQVLADEHDLVVGSTLRFRGADLILVGLSRGTSGFMTPLAFSTRQTANALNKLPQTASFVLVSPDRGVDPQALARRIETEVGGVSARSADDLAANDRELIVGAFSGPLLAMILIGGAVAVLVIALTVYTATRDRSHEYATLKAIGLGRLALLRIVAAQSTMLALLGTALGALLAWGASQGVGELAPKYLIVLNASDIVRIALAALLFALAAGLIPARYLASLEPATAFRR
jgi:putative ABC transport system permease protein